jgi:hypothetical protein
VTAYEDLLMTLDDDIDDRLDDTDKQWLKIINYIMPYEFK